MDDSQIEKRRRTMHSTLGKPGYYTVLAFKDEAERLAWEDEYNV